MCFGLQWQLSFPGKHAFGHRHYTAHTLHVCIIFRQIFRGKNTSLLWQGNRHYTTHTFSSQTKLFAGTVHCKGLRSNLVHSPRTQCRVLCFMWLSQNSKKNSVTPQNAFWLIVEIPWCFFLGGTLSLNKTIMRIPVSQSHGSWSPSSGPAAPVDIPAPWGQNSWGFLLPKTLG